MAMMGNPEENKNKWFEGTYHQLEDFHNRMEVYDTII